MLSVSPHYKKILFKFTLQIYHDERTTQNTSSHQSKRHKHEDMKPKGVKTGLSHEISVITSV